MKWSLKRVGEAGTDFMSEPSTVRYCDLAKVLDSRIICNLFWGGDGVVTGSILNMSIKKLYFTSLLLLVRRLLK